MSFDFETKALDTAREDHLGRLKMKLVNSFAVTGKDLEGRIKRVLSQAAWSLLHDGMRQL